MSITLIRTTANKKNEILNYNTLIIYLPSLLFIKTTSYVL